MSERMAAVLAGHAVVQMAPNQRNGSCFCGERLEWRLPTIHSRINALSEHQAAMLTAAGFGDLNRAAMLGATLAYDAIEESALAEAKAQALEEAADGADALGIEALGPTMLRTRAAVIRGDT